uniref:Uncharacterized protein n=1 Tax=Romanomermis culicivorax TaxID=13658 RepID=A0A915HRR8_ROMCU
MQQSFSLAFGTGSRYLIPSTLVPGRRQQLMRGAWNTLGGRDVSSHFPQRFGAGSSGASFGVSPASTSIVRAQSLLDKEAVTCLLVLFFVDDSRLNVGRLHKILRSLCYHTPTRDWIVRSLLNILEKTQPQDVAMTTPSTIIPSAEKSRKFTPEVKGLNDKLVCGSKRLSQNWLNINLSSTVGGSKIEVFEFSRRPIHSSQGTKKGLAPSGVVATGSAACVHVNPLAAINVCRNVVDTLIILAKSFPAAFFPSDLQDRLEAPPKLSISKTENLNQTSTDATIKSHGQTHAANKADFWDILLRLDATHNTHASTQTPRKISFKSGALPGTTVSSSPMTTKSGAVVAVGGSPFDVPFVYSSLENSPFGCLLSMLKYNAIENSETLTDSLLRLLLLIINFLPSVSEEVKSLKKVWQKKVEQHRDDANKPVNLLPHLSHLVEIVTQSKFSEECLEQGRGVLLRAAQVFSNGTREAIFFALMEAARKLGVDLYCQLKQLLTEIDSLRSTETNVLISSTPTSSWSKGCELMDHSLHNIQDVIN